MKKKNQKQLIIYQGKNGAIEFREDFNEDTIWGTQKQIAELFSVGVPAINKHLKNIFANKELKEKVVVSILEITTKHGAVKGKTQTKRVKFYNLDAIISIGYRVNSKQATQFRVWATKILKQHLLDGYTINKKQVGKNYKKFMHAISDVRALLPKNNKTKTEDILDLINTFADTWFSLGAYDTDSFPKTGLTKKRIVFNANELSKGLQDLKQRLITKKQATNLFGQERNSDAIKGVIGNIFQSAFGKDVYPSSEEKASHLLYFIIKNHPFIDGNKRSGAFAFIWFLRKAKLLRASLTPEALTVLTLLIAESQPKDKDRMIGLVLLLLSR